MATGFYSQCTLKVLFASVAILLATAVTVVAQPISQDTLEAHRQFLTADSLQKHARYDTSSHYYAQAARLYQRFGHWNRVIDSKLNLVLNRIETGKYDQAQTLMAQTGKLIQQHISNNVPLRARMQRLSARVDIEQSRYDLAIKKLQKGLELLSENKNTFQKQRAYFIFYLGEVYNSQGKHEQALDQFFQSLDIYNRSEDNPGPLFLSKVYNSIGTVQRKIGDFAAALEYYHKSTKIDKEALGPDHPNVAQGLNNIAIIKYYQGDYQQALDYMKEATHTLSRYWGEKHPQVAIGYNNISIVYSEMGKLEEAIQYMQKSIAIKEEVIGKVNLDVAIGYQNLGALNYDLKEYDEAIKNYHKALGLLRDIFDGGHPEIANIYANLGQAYSAQTKYSKALEYLEKDLDMNTRLLGSDHPFIADTHTKVAENYTMQGNPALALPHYQKAISILTGNASVEPGIQEISFDQVTHPVFLMEALQGKGDAHRTLFNESGETKHLQEALRTYLAASSLVDNMQTQYRSDESKLMLGERADDIYNSGLETAYQLYQATGDPRQVRYALYFAEQGKAQVLLEQLMETEARSFANVPDSLVDKEQQIRREITRLHGDLKTKTGQKTHIDSLHVQGLRDSLFTLKKRLTNHIERLEQDYPRYYQLKYQDVNITTSDIKQVLEPGQTMIEYALMDRALYAFVVNKQHTKLKKIEIDSTLHPLINDFRSGIENEDKQVFADISYQLYRKLIQPLQSYISGNSLVIVPDGKLHYLPFEALIRKPANPNEAYKSFSYLLNKYTISYAPSATLLQFWNQDAGIQEDDRSLMAVAPVFSSLDNSISETSQNRNTPPFSSLPLSRYEVQQVDSIMNRKGYSSRLYLDHRASEAAFKRSPLQQYDIIHLATHAFLAQDSVANPGIYFASDQGESQDGILRLEEVYNLDLNARLVVLSACETGLGKLLQGEGVMSLARAFEYAGAQNLFVSLWKVDDRSTSQLMINFYKNYDNKSPLREAVRQAKLHLMNDTRYASPRFWAPFILLGK